MITTSSPLDYGLDTTLLVYCVVDGHPAGAACEQFPKARSGWFTSPLVLIEAKTILTKVYSVDALAASHLP
jgi:hypothetical protein